ncbi:AN1-type zinc finger protein 4 isoform X1 [Solea senegalensis]|uniref:AN1-type zinc finger protein 4 isoform X1 n=1 Tax=Solea senegalensis TaxID=28829 RepID=A0AAV6S621_SOLSE|nr:AN1-type zinc finger protein 4 isoform X1 [Solea senegalensis]
MTDKKEPPFFNDDSPGAFHYKIPLYDTMELFIETLTGTCFELRVLPFEAVISVKAKIQRLEGIPVAQQHLIWNNLELDDEHCLHDYGIAEGCTLKLVLAMRGGPINIRRVTMEDPIKEVADLMESTKEEGWEKGAANKQVTFVVYRKGDQLSFFRVVDRGDGTLTPLSESLSSGSGYNVYAEEENGETSAAAQQSLENSITMNKMKLLKAKMEDMNLNKKPKKSAMVKPQPPVSPHPCVGSPGSSNTRHHHRLFRSLHQINQPQQLHALPPITDHEIIDPFPPSAAAGSLHLSIPRQPSPSFSSSSCYMLHEEEPWETCPAFAKIRPPPKVSRLDIGSTRLMRDCVYPQLPPLCTRGPPEALFDPVEPAGEAVGLGLLDEATGLLEPTRPGAPYGKLPDPLSLDVSSQPDGGCQSLEVGTQHQLPLSPSPLSTWTLGKSDTLTSRTDRTQLSTALHISPSPPLPTSSTTRLLPQPFDSTLSCLQPSIQAQPPAHVKPGNTSPHTSSAHPPLLCSVNAETSGQGSHASRLPSIPTNRLLQDGYNRHRAAASYMATNTLASTGGVMTSFGRLGTPTYHLPPVKAPTGSKKKSSKHCFLCDKKTGLATSYKCRCGHNFCAAHRYAETHDCTYDYKSAGRRFLQETNPLISAPKLPKI